MPMRNRLGAGCWCALNAACAGDGVVVWAREDAAAAAAPRATTTARAAAGGAAAPARLHVVHLGAGDQNLDLRTALRHTAGDAESVQDIRNVAGERAKLTFKGRIAVPVTGQKTNADQICKSLLLDDGATVNAMPSLEIVADDVKCTHGATIADLDEEGPFYLNSRMLSEKDARKLLLAFCYGINPMGGATAVLRAALAAAFAAAAPAPSRGALACLRSCADSLAYPPDARAHFDEIHRALDNYSHVSYARLAGYRGPWIENRWIAATRADLARADAAGGSLRDVAGPFVPLLVPWLDEWLAPRMWHYPPGMVEKLLGLLRPSVAYVTVSQTNCGVTGDFTRERLGAYQGVEVFVGKAEDWRGVMADSRFSLCPRGFGRSSYHVAETINLGLVPIHVYSDTPWLPYPERFADVGFNASIDGFADLLDALHALPDAEVERLRPTRRFGVALQL
ncbi:hypothetical protein JL722_14968 [Aureococcus anophagefferens]|nr:hypothetical protein JL722_14968 [Aureococcus anophagefferens]